VHDPIGFFEVAAGWLRHFLGDGSARLPDLAPVTFFETLGRGWRTAETWPPAAARVRFFHAHSDGGLSTDPPTATSHRSYHVDPTVGLAALPWDWTTPTPAVPPDISPDDHRATTWTTPPLPEPLLITGNPVVLVRLASDRPDVPLRAWLSHVRSDGSSTLISQGWVRPTHLLGHDLAQDGYAEVRVPLAPTCYRLNPGERLRLALAGSHFPALVPAPDPASFTFEIGPAGTLLELPVEEDKATTGPTPAWPAPLKGRPEAQLESSSRHSVERDLDDADGRYRQSRRMRFALEAGGELTWDLESSALIARDDPGSMRLETQQTWRVVGGPASVEIRTRMWQTFDEQEVSAEIDVDGRAFFERQWRLRFDTYPWRIRR
jgi:hypothetical protein